MRTRSPITALLVASLTLAGCQRARPDTPLTIAAAEDRADDVRALLLRGIAVDATDRYGWTALMWAARTGSLETMKVLIDGGADVDARDHWINGWTPMMHAIHKGRTEAVRLLIGHGADVNKAAPNGMTALMHASAGGCDCDGDAEPEGEALVRFLLDHGADPRSETLDHTSALTYAVTAGRTAVVKALFERAPDLTLQPVLENEAALLLARLRGRAEILEMVRKAREGV